MTTLNIQGVGFTGATAVVYDGTPASNFTVVNDTTIHATFNRVIGIGPGPIPRVTLAGGNTVGFNYTVM